MGMEVTREQRVERALRRRWVWALTELALGLGLLAGAWVTITNGVPEGALAIVIGAPLVVLALIGLVATARIGRLVSSLSWRACRGRYVFIPHSTAVVEALDPVTGARILVRVWSPNQFRKRSLGRGWVDLWLAVDRSGPGVVAGAAMHELLLVSRYPEESWRLGRLERELARYERVWVPAMARFRGGRRRRRPPGVSRSAG